MKRNKFSSLLGYIAGIVTGITYGMNPVFAKPLLEDGVSVDTMLFFRYIFSVLLMGAWLFFKGESFKINLKQAGVFSLMGLVLGCSSLFLFMAYNYIPSGQATTIIYLYPVLVAIIMVFNKVYPKWQVWLSILLTFIGIVILCKPQEGLVFDATGFIFSFLSALAFAIYIVLNRNSQARSVSSNMLTFFVLFFGSFLFVGHHFYTGGSLLQGIAGWQSWALMLGLAIFPTIISMVTLAIGIRLIGATKTSVLGVFEPITAILAGTFLFGEEMTVNIIVGVCICISAIVFMALTTSVKK